MRQSDKSILRFVALTLLAIIPPVLLFVAFFFVFDPFKATRSYTSEEYFPDPKHYPARVSLNKGMITVESFQRNLERGDTCNSFIFGSSISIYYDIDHWKTLLPAPDSVKAMHFDSSSESLYSLARKVAFIDSNVNQFRNALIILDPIIMSMEEDDSPFSIDPPELHPGNPFYHIHYLYTFFRASTNADFFKNWLPYIIDGKVHDNAHNPLFESQPIIYDSVSNQETMPEFDCLISADPDRYYSMFPLVESPDSVAVSPVVLHSGKLTALRAIAYVFKRRGTDYRLIIGPNRHKIALNSADMDSLCSIFGKPNVFDYSYSLSRRLETDTLLYDNTHYRPSFAKELLNFTYLPCSLLLQFHQ